jgi:hypothetical protein
LAVFNQDRILVFLKPKYVKLQFLACSLCYRRKAKNARSPAARADPGWKKNGPFSKENGPFSTENGPFSTENGPFSTENGPFSTENGPFSTENGPFSTENGPFSTENGPFSTENMGEKQAMLKKNSQKSIWGKNKPCLKKMLEKTSPFFMRAGLTRNHEKPPRRTRPISPGPATCLHRNG